MRKKILGIVLSLGLLVSITGCASSELLPNPFARIKELKEKVTELETANTELETENEELETSKTELETAKEDLETEKEELEKQVEMLGEENEKLEEQIEVLQEQVVFLRIGNREGMMEFTSEDGSYSIYLNEEWLVEDMGVENWIAAFNKPGSEGTLILQFTKGVMDTNVSNLSEIREIVEESYALMDLKPLTIKSNALNNIEAYTGNMYVEEVDGKGCVAYGETDYAYYVFLMLTEGTLDDDMIAEFQTACGSFMENIF